MKLQRLSQLTSTLRETLQPQIVGIVGERFWDTPFTEVSNQVLAASYGKFTAACVDESGRIVEGATSDFITDRCGTPTAVSDVGIALAALHFDGVSLEADDEAATPQPVRDAAFALHLARAASTAARAGDGSFA